MTAEVQSSRHTDLAAQARAENFPVASMLIPRSLRAHVVAFYGFARTADDIADNPAIAPSDRISRLDALEAALTHGSTAPDMMVANRLHRSLAQTGVSDRHARDLLSAFRQDARQNRYGTGEELIAYCRLSAAPVGRYLLDLHGEDPADHALSDPLCNALQIINHLQDCRNDLQQMNRVYLPLDWLHAAGTDELALNAPRSSAALRSVLDRGLDLCDELLARSRPMPQRLGSVRLGAEAAAIHTLARRMVRRLRSRDPLCQRTRLSRPAAVLVAVTAVCHFGLIRLFARPAPPRQQGGQGT